MCPYQVLSVYVRNYSEWGVKNNTAKKQTLSGFGMVSVCDFDLGPPISSSSVTNCQSCLLQQEVKDYDEELDRQIVLSVILQIWQDLIKQIRDLQVAMLFVTYASHLPGKWNKSSCGEPSTKYEVVWSGSLAVEEGWKLFVWLYCLIYSFFLVMKFAKSAVLELCVC